MANRGFESGPSESNDGKDGAPKKDSANSSVPRIERPIGRTELPKFAQRLPVRPLNEAITPPKHERPSQPFDQSSLKPLHQNPEGNDRTYRRMDPGELAARAAQVQREHTEHLRRAYEETEKADKKDTPGSEKTDTPVSSGEGPQRQGDRTHPLSREEWRELMSYAPKTSPAEANDKSKGDAQQNASDDERFRNIVQQEDLKDPGAVAFVESENGALPLAAEEEDSLSDFTDKLKTDAEFQDFVDRHPELHDLAVPAASDDETFRDMVHSETGEDPGPVQWQEGDPDESPRNIDDHQPPRPPFPPIAEGAAWGDDDPESGDFGARNVANPDLLEHPWAHAGNLAAPATLAGLTALEAQHQLDSLRHTAREAGLAGAVGILGLGLVVEHFAAKRRDKKQQRQINKHHKEAIHTRQTLQQEQAAHQRTRQELQRLRGEQRNTAEQVRRNNVSPAGEVASMAAAAVAATELARKKVRQAEAVESVPLSTTARRELQKQIDADPSLALAVQKSRERQENAVLAHETVSRETRHERLHSKVTDNNRVAAGGALRNPRLTSQYYATNATTTNYAQVPHTPKSTAKNRAAELLVHRWTWAVAGFIAVAALLIAFTR